MLHCGMKVRELGNVSLITGRLAVYRAVEKLIEKHSVINSYISVILSPSEAVWEQ